MSLEIDVLTKSQLKGLDFHQLHQMYMKNYPFLTHLLELKLPSIITVCDEVRQKGGSLPNENHINRHVQPAYEYMDREFDKTQKITSLHSTSHDDTDISSHLVEVSPNHEVYFSLYLYLCLIRLYTRLRARVMRIPAMTCYMI